MAFDWRILIRKYIRVLAEGAEVSPKQPHRGGPVGKFMAGCLIIIYPPMDNFPGKQILPRLFFRTPSVKPDKMPDICFALKAACCAVVQESPDPPAECTYKPESVKLVVL